LRDIFLSNFISKLHLLKFVSNLTFILVFRLPEIREVFSGLLIDHHVYDDWSKAISDEYFRRMDIAKELIVKKRSGISPAPLLYTPIHLNY